LRNLGVKNLVCVGFTADICLPHTVVGAMYRKYRVVVLRDCNLAAEFADTFEAMHMTWFGIRYVEAMAGFTTTSEELIAACSRA
jgi:nicotinamidase-related amidase